MYSIRQIVFFSGVERCGIYTSINYYGLYIPVLFQSNSYLLFRIQNILWVHAYEDWFFLNTVCFLSKTVQFLTVFSYTNFGLHYLISLHNLLMLCADTVLVFIHFENCWKLQAIFGTPRYILYKYLIHLCPNLFTCVEYLLYFISGKLLHCLC